MNYLLLLFKITFMDYNKRLNSFTYNSLNYI